MGEYLKTRNQLTESIFNTSFGEVETAIFSNQPFKQTSLNQLTEDLAKTFGIGKVKTTQMLGISDSRKSRNQSISPDILDRAASYIQFFARVSSIIGADATKQWLQSPKQALKGACPIDLLSTRLGQSQLGDMLTALEDGAYL